METSAELSKIEAFVEKHPQYREVFDKLIAAGFSGTFKKYLRTGDVCVLERFFEEARNIDFAWIKAHRDALLGDVQARPLELEPVEPGRIREEERPVIEAAGRASLARGEWASVIFAGGAATRFFSEAGEGSLRTKALFPLTPIAKMPFLAQFVAEALAIGIRVGRMPFVVVMTSRLTEKAIRDFIASKTLWGFPKFMAPILSQREQPRLDEEGDLIVEADGSIVVTGDGHGGVFRALLSGDRLAERLSRAGVRGLILHNVDNAAARPFDMARIGWHVRGGYSMTLSVVERARATEKVGLVGLNRVKGRIEVVEYSVCPSHLAQAVAPDGTPLFRWAHINTNLVDLSAIRPDIPPTLYTGKKVEIGGRQINTSSFEMLNQHLASLLDASSVGVLALERSEFFLPTKSLSGEDSLEETRTAISRMAAARLRRMGAMIDETATVEIAPWITDEDLASMGLGHGWRLMPESRLFIGARHGVEGPIMGGGLVLEPGSTLIIDAAMPFGRPKFDEVSRAISEDLASASRVTIGDNVTIEAGARVEVKVEEAGRVRIRDNVRLGDHLLYAGTGESVSV